MPSRVPLLLLPGLACDGELFADVVARLGDRVDARVADLGGHGTVGALAEAALAAMPAPRFALGGLSMGGYVAFEILRRAPQRVAAVAFMSTSARPDTPEASENRRRLMRMAEQDYSAVVDSLMPKLLHPSHAADPRLVRIVRGMAARVGVAAFVRQERAIIGRPDSRPELSAIRCPTLVLAGGDDALMPAEIHEEIAGQVPGAVLAMIDHCGHLASIEQPQVVANVLERWIARVR